MNDSRRELLVLSPRTRAERWEQSFDRFLAGLVVDGIDLEFDSNNELPSDLPENLSAYINTVIYLEDLDHYRSRLERDFPGLNDARLRREQERLISGKKHPISPLISADGRRRLFLMSLIQDAPRFELGWYAELTPMSESFVRRQLGRSDEHVFEQLFARLTTDPAKMCPWKCRFSVLFQSEAGKWSEYHAILQRCLMDLGEVTGRRQFSDMGVQSIRLYLSQMDPSDPLICGDPWSITESIVQLYEATGEPQLLEIIRHRMDLREKHYKPWDGMYGLWYDDKWVRDSSLATMVVPAVRAAKYLASAKAIYDQAVHQATRTEKLLRNEATGLFHFGSDGKRRTPTLIGHGSMWHMFAYCNLLTYLPREHPGFDDCAQVFRRLARALAKVQGPQGLWHQHLDRVDSSMGDILYSNAILGAIYRGITLGLLDEDEFGPVSRRALDGVKLRSFAGYVVGSSVSTGLSLTSRYYLTRPFNVEFGYGGWHQIFPMVENLRWRRNSESTKLRACR